MLGESELEGLDRQLASFRVASSQHHDTLQEILERYAQLTEDYRRLRSDYEEEKESREKYKKLARGQERNPFVLVLIDGDGYIFDDTLIKAGADGGVRAANLLHAAIKDRLIRFGRDADECRIMVRVYCNLAGLSRALARAGLSGNEARSLAPFSASFTRAQELFDFVDAGDKKENADFKIREMFRLFADNSQCKHIFFAGCHDSGYLSLLSPFTGKTDRISLIRGSYFSPELQALGLRIEDMPNIFRTYPLEGYENIRPYVSVSSPNKPTSYALSTPTAYGAPPANKEICKHYLKGSCKFGSGCRKLHPVNNSDFSSNNWRTNGASDMMHTPGKPLDNHMANRGLAQSFSTPPAYPNVSTAALLPRSAPGPDQIPVNKDGYRLDVYLEPPSSEDWHAYQTRAKIHKPCNDYQLRGTCHNGPDCGYDHNPMPPELKHVLKVIVHDYPCGRKGACRLANCPLGHICYKEGCRGKGCRLNYTMHGVDPHTADWVLAETRNGVQDSEADMVSVSGGGGGGADLDSERQSEASGGSHRGDDVD